MCVWLAGAHITSKAYVCVRDESKQRHTHEKHPAPARRLIKDLSFCKQEIEMHLPVETATAGTARNIRIIKRVLS